VQPQSRSEEHEVRQCRRSHSASGFRFGNCHKKCQRYKKSELNAEFVNDVNYPDGSTIAPGITLIKQWQVKNTGPIQWPEGSKLIFLRGNRELLGDQEEFNVPIAQRDQVVDISCPINVPLKAGRYSAYFKLADKDRNVFGRRFWIEFTVPEDKIVSPSKESKKEVVNVEDQEDGKGKVTVGINSTIPIPTAPTVTTSSSSIVPVPTPSPTPIPAPIAVSEISKFSSALGVLERMGFVNQQLNISLLERGKGNLEQVVTWLLEMENVPH
jgi:next-to-BRCA1 protein 1